MTEILDFHNHIFPEPIARRIITSLQTEMGFTPYGTGTVSGLRNEMKSSGVKACVALAVATSPALVESTNNWIMGQQKEDIIPVGSIHPLLENYQAEIKRLKEAGIKGIKFHSLFQQCRPDDEKVFPLYEEIIRQGLFAIFHSGPGLVSTPGEEVLATPKRFRALLDTFPDMVMVIAHFGGFHMIEESKKHLLGENIYIDTSYPPGLSFQSQDWVLDILHRHDPERILFGTDTPFASQKEDAAFILDLPIPAELKEKILWKNGQRLLGLNEE